MTFPVRVLGLTMVMCAAMASGVAAQDEPIPRFAADVRGAIPRFKADPAIASAAGVTQPNLATRGLGLVGGVHWYALHMRKLTVGLGGEVLLSRGSRTLPTADESETKGPTARTHFTAISPQLSFNFGGRNGWSYISGGLGWATFYVDREDSPAAGPQPRTKSLNYGGGARWFSKAHVAFSADLRFYALSPQPGTATSQALPRTRNLVVSVGVGLK